jgi:hypothetical protein
MDPIKFEVGTSPFWAYLQGMKYNQKPSSSFAAMAMILTMVFLGLSACGDNDSDNIHEGDSDTVSAGDVISTDVESLDTEITDQVPEDAQGSDVVQTDARVSVEDTAPPLEDTAIPSEDTGGDPDITLPLDVGTENPEGDDDLDLLTNAEEAQWGTDPQDSDSDDDGYLDGHEVMEDKDPTDPTSVIYLGGWPYNPDKDNVEQGDWNGTVGNGELLPRLKAYDQYGDLVDIYDLMGQGRMVVLDVGTWFCDPCKAMAAYFSSGEISHMEEFCDTVPACWWKETYSEVLDLINNDQIYWVTVIFSLGNVVTQEDAALWHDTFPHDKILVLADSTLVLKEYLDFKAMPHIDVLDETLHFISYNHSGPTGGMNFLINSF